MGATPTLQWSPVPSAVGYKLYITDTTTGQPIPGSPVSVPAGTGSGDLSYPLAAPLPASDNYAFYVRAVFADGSLSPPGSTDSFSLSTASDLAGPPTPGGPAGSSGSLQPTFRWSSTVASAAGYQIEIKDVTAGTIGVVLSPTSVIGTSYTLNQILTTGHTYQWQVAAFDGNGQETPWSQPLNFQATISAPIPASPSGNSASAVPTFLWSAVAGAAGYQIEVDDITVGGAAVTIAPTNVSGPSFTPAAPLAAGLTYQWQVRAYDSSGSDSAWSPPLTFSIASLPPPPAYVTGVTGVLHVKKKVRAITVAFDEALEAASADSSVFYEVVQRVKQRKKIVFKHLAIATVTYDGSRAVTVRLARPVQGPVQLIVQPGILAANGHSGRTRDTHRPRSDDVAEDRLDRS